MSWFYDTFLPSLLERAGTNHGMWLSRKQTAICIEKMQVHTVMVLQFQGDYFRHNYYTMEWNGRHVSLNYSKLNGCGQITFGFTVEEAEESSRKYAMEKQREAEERMERKRKWAAWARENAPEKLAERITRYQSMVQAKEKALDEIRQEMAEPDYDEEFRINDTSYMDMLNKELADAEAMLAIYL